MPKASKCARHCARVGEPLGRVIRQQADHGLGQVAAAHVGERIVIDHIVVVAGAQKLQEVQPAF